MRSFVAALLLVATAACGNSSTAVQTGDEVGRYALVSVNGNAVPCDVAVDGATARITAGTLTLSAGGYRPHHQFVYAGRSEPEH